ncbi:TetR family transcriptional regulator [Epidermidibacterium keratini]|uniref:TetR family transcriptional regulator n=1 Tax=Epidermidibacterium keratini TaxID=1891644 RepID=A0A7M3T529_9ACTN|nr:TetR/AcrR family transcriptional regulator [Epidermidibacterium keratini]QHB98889.1 TetR family transcriptional regulator [Epidermidibacterium keratini]
MEGTFTVPEMDGGSADRVAVTRRSLLRAAREVFVVHGYYRATVTEIVERSGTSTGSLYNRFGGKENLFLELHREHTQALWQAARVAMEDANRDGADDPLRAFIAGVRSILSWSWTERDLVLLFFASGPPGFDALSVDGERQWVDENVELLRLTDVYRGWELAAAITGVVVTAAKRIARSADADDATDVADYFLGLIERLATLD